MTLPFPIPSAMNFYTLVVRDGAAGSTWQPIDGDFHFDNVLDHVMDLYEPEKPDYVETLSLVDWVNGLPAEVTFRFRTEGRWHRGRIIKTKANPTDIARRIGELNSDR